MSARVDEMTADPAVEQARAIEHVAIAERRPAVADARGFCRSGCSLACHRIDDRGGANPLSKHRAAV
jgi:hypothetical protein